MFANTLSVCWHGFYLILGFCVSWLVVTGVGFIIGSWMLGFSLGLLFGGYVWYWVCLFVGWQVCNNHFSITDFKLSHGFYSKNGLINGHIGS